MDGDNVDESGLDSSVSNLTDELSRRLNIKDSQAPASQVPRVYQWDQPKAMADVLVTPLVGSASKQGFCLSNWHISRTHTGPSCICQ